MDEPKSLVRAMDDKEIRLNCVLLAVTAKSYMQGRLSDPLTVANEFYEWVLHGGKPNVRPAVQWGGRPAEVTEGFGAAEPPNAEAMRANTGGGDLIDVPGAPRARRPA